MLSQYIPFILNDYFITNLSINLGFGIKLNLIFNFLNQEI